MQKRETDHANTQSSKLRDEALRPWLQKAQSLRRLLRQLWNIVLLSLGCSLGALSLGCAALGGFLLRQVKRQPPLHGKADKPFDSTSKGDAQNSRGDAL